MNKYSGGTGADIINKTPGQRERILVPAIDVINGNDSVLLLADMPGVTADSVDVHIEKNVLTIEGHRTFQPQEGFRMEVCEAPSGLFRREFEISDWIDGEGIKAQYKDGRLRLTLPKRRNEVRKVDIEVK